METTTENFNARSTISNALQQEARRHWDDIIDVAETRGVHLIKMILSDTMHAIGRKRITSRSTSTICNLLDDLKDTIVVGAYTTITRCEGETDEYIIEELKVAASHSIASF
jgi:hypothetical protein